MKNNGKTTTGAFLRRPKDLWTFASALTLLSIFIQRNLVLSIGLIK